MEIARPAGSGVTSLLSKGHLMFIEHGSEVVMYHTKENIFTAKFSDLVPMEIQLRCLLQRFENSQGHVIALPVTLTSGKAAIANFDSTVWPQWIRSAIREKLIEAGGVPSVSPLIIDGSGANQYVRRVTRQESISPVTSVAPATDDDVQPLKETSSSKSTEPEPNDT